MENGRAGKVKKKKKEAEDMEQELLQEIASYWGTLCGASLPEKFRRIMNRFEDNKEALFDAGMAYALSQIIDLLANDVDGIHLYTMNNPAVARRICEGIKNII